MLFLAGHEVCVFSEHEAQQVVDLRMKNSAYHAKGCSSKNLAYQTLSSEDPVYFFPLNLQAVHRIH